MKKTIGLIILLIVMLIVFTGCKKTSNLDADKFKEILLHLGYNESEIYDETFEEGELARWVGLSNTKELYACVFEFNSNSAAETKKQESEEYFSEREFLYSKIEKSTLLIVAADEEHKAEANKIVEELK